MSTPKPESPARFAARLARRLWAICCMCVAVALIGAAVLLTVLRLALPLAGGYQAAIEDRIGDYLGAPVEIAELDVEWHGIGPRLVLEDVAVRHPDGGRIRFSEAFVDFGFIGSWGELRIRNLILGGLQLDVTLDADGRIGFWGITFDPRSLAESGLPTGDQSGDAGAGVVAGLLDISRLQIVDTEIRVDTAGGDRYYIGDLDISVLNERGVHRLAVKGTPPRGWGERFDFRLDGRHLLAAHTPASARVYLNGRDLALERWHALAGPMLAPSAALAGRSDFELWLDWRDGGLERVRGAIDAGGVRFDNPGAGVTAGFDRASGRFDWRRQDAGWRLAAGDFRFEKGDSGWSSAMVGVERSQGTWRVVADRVDLAHLAAVATGAPLPAGWAERVGALAPVGRATDVRLAFDAGGAFAIRGGFAGVGWQPHAGWPGIEGLDGRLALNGGGGTIDVDAEGVELAQPGLLRGPIGLARLTGHARLERTGDRIEVQVPRLATHNDDVAARGRARMTLVPGRAPVVDMQVDFRDGDTSAVSAYLPVGIMDPKIIEWTDEAVGAGRVTRGTMLLRGSTADFPFADHSGVFTVDFDVADLDLAYADDWPPLEDAAASVRFHGPGLEVVSRRARIMGNPIDRARARFADLGTGDLRVDAATDADMQGLIRVVNNSPLAGRLGPFFDGASGTGRARLELGLDIPVERAEEARVAGHLRMTDNGLRQPRFGLDFSAIDGRVDFTARTLAMDGVEARLNGEPVAIDAHTRDDRVVLDARGNIDIAGLLGGHGLGLERFVEGTAPWHIQVELAEPDDSGLPLETPIMAASSLVGTRVDLPAPLGKPASVAVPVRLELTLEPNAERQQATLSYGDRAGAVAEFGLGDGARLHRATLNLGPAIARLHDAAGVSLTGRAQTLDLAGWQAFLAEAAATDGEPGDAGMPATIDVEFGRVHWHGREMTDVSVDGARGDEAWQGRLASNEATGDITWPFAPTGEAPLRLDFEWIDLGLLLSPREEDAAAGHALGQGLDPAAVPPLDIRVERLLLDDYKLTNAVVVTRPDGDGMRIRRVAAGDDRLRAQGEGAWRRVGDGSRTVLAIEVSAENFGDGLDAIVAGDSGFVDGEGRIGFDLEWPGPPWAPELAGLVGTIDIEVDDGMITAVDTGAARVISLFSLQTLPRRLSLDFSGIFNSGFEYDTIRGALDLAEGDAHIERLEMDGPPGRVQVSGRIGYVDRVFDQRIEFRPSLKYSLPVIGALAGGPAAAVAITLIQQIMRGVGQDIDRTAEVEYRLTGSWDEPNVERVRVDVPDSSDDDDGEQWESRPQP